MEANNEYDLIMDFKEFDSRCMPQGAISAEFNIRPINIATKDGVDYKIVTKDNKVYFKKVLLDGK